MEDAREVRRRSICCGADVLHPYPMGGGRLSRSLSLICSSCGAAADTFEVTVGDFKVWPLPKGYKAPKRVKKHPRYPADEDNPVAFPIHLPRRLLKRLIYDII